jgi:hypothetical protein
VPDDGVLVDVGRTGDIPRVTEGELIHSARNRLERRAFNRPRFGLGGREEEEPSASGRLCRFCSRSPIHQLHRKAGTDSAVTSCATARLPAVDRGLDSLPKVNRNTAFQADLHPS